MNVRIASVDEANVCSCVDPQCAAIRHYLACELSQQSKKAFRFEQYYKSACARANAWKVIASEMMKEQTEMELEMREEYGIDGDSEEWSQNEQEQEEAGAWGDY